MTPFVRNAAFLYWFQVLLSLVVGTGSKILYTLNLGKSPWMGWGGRWSPGGPQGDSASQTSCQQTSEQEELCSHHVSFLVAKCWLVFYADFAWRPQMLCSVSLIAAALNCWNSSHPSDITHWMPGVEQSGTWGPGRKEILHPWCAVFRFAQRVATHVKHCGLFKALWKAVIWGVTLLYFEKTEQNIVIFSWTYDAIRDGFGDSAVWGHFTQTLKMGLAG